MAIVTQEVQIAKEVDEVGRLVEELVEDIRDGKDAGQIVGENLKNLTDAIAGLDQVDDELKANRKVVMQTIGRRTGGLADAIIGKEA